MVIDRDVTASTHANSITETAVYSFSVPANTLGTDRMLRLTMIGELLANHAGSRAYTTRVKYGSTTIFQNINGPSSASANPHAVILTVEMSALNATGAQVARGVMFEGPQGSVAGVGSSGSTVDDVAIHNGITEDSTGALTLQVTVDHGVADANQSFTCHTVQLELV